ncbi:MAG: amylo-alpha-1,6-glucosidase [bacterium]
MKKTIRLIASDSRDPEWKAASRWLRSQTMFRIVSGEFKTKTAGARFRPDVTWIHGGYDAIASDRKARLLTSVRKSLSAGSHLLLTLDACRFVEDLGLEKNAPNWRERGEWPEAARLDKICGFQSWAGHPLFVRFGTGCYTWRPAKGDSFSICAYKNGQRPGNARVIAVDKQFIALDQTRTLIWEYTVGRSRVLCVGGYVYFSAENQRCCPHLERFMRNVLLYAAGVLTSCTKRTYWSHGSDKSYRPQSGDEYASSQWPVRTEGIFALPSERELNVSQSDLNSAVGPERNEFWDVTGRRMLMIGKVGDARREIWSHPIRLLNDLNVVSTEYEGATIRPELVHRFLKVKKRPLVETNLCGYRASVALIHYAFQRPPKEFTLGFGADFRLMWPYAEGALGPLKHRWDEGLNALLVTDARREYSAVYGFDRRPARIRVNPYREGGNGGIKVDVSFAGSTALTFVISGGKGPLRKHVALLRRTMANLRSVYEEQIRRRKGLERESLKVTAPDARFNEGYRWILAGMEKFFVETPGLGASYMAGYAMTKPGWGAGRPGYAWYFGRDSIWTAFAALGLGQFESARSVLEFLIRHQDITGKILHELTTSGSCHYDAADSTPLFVILMGRYVRASGDTNFLKQNGKAVEKAFEFCKSTDTDDDGLIENTDVGHGWIEDGVLWPPHVTVDLAALWAEAVGEYGYLQRIQNSKSKVQNSKLKIIRKIEERFWDEKVEFYAATVRPDGSMNREHTVFPCVPLLFRQLNPDRAARVLDEIGSPDFSTDCGVRILRKSSPQFNPRSYQGGSVWPLFTGWASLAAYRYGRPEQGFRHLMSTLRTYRDMSPGNIEEVFEGDEYKSFGVCPHQCWSHAMVLQPIAEGLLGIEADAVNGVLTLRPQIPEEWKSLNVRNIRVGWHRVHLTYRRESGRAIFSLSKSSPGPLKIQFSPGISGVGRGFTLRKRVKMAIEL